jgi:ketosteroid isomerase-like protein
VSSATATTADLIRDIDSMDAAAFASHLSENCVLRYANNDEVVGRDAIERAIAAFYETIKALCHDVVEEWTVDDATIIQFEVTYTRLDDRKVTLPAVTIYRRGGELIDDYRIFIDLTPVYA